MAEQAVLLFAPPTEPTRIGAIECDVLLEQELTLSSEVTEHPVEDGFPVHDHVIRKARKIAMTIAISNSPVTWYDRFGGPNPERMSDAIAKLNELYEAGDPITIVTADKIYENMVMTDCRIGKRVEDGKILKVPLELTQIRKVQVRTAEIPEEYVDALTKGQAGATEQDAGTAKTDDIGDGAAPDSSNSNSDNGSGGGTGTAGKSKSILKGLFG